MTRKLLTLLAGLALISSAGPARSDEPPRCAVAKRVHSWSVVDDRTIFLQYLNKKRRFKVGFLGPCREVKWAVYMIVARGGPGHCIRAGDTLVFSRMPFTGGMRLTGVEGCQVQSIEYAPAAEGEQPWAPRKRSKPVERPPVF